MLVIRVLSIILALMGATALWFSQAAYTARQSFIDNAWAANGTITEIVRRSAPSRIGFTTLYHYRVHFRSYRDDRIEFVTTEYHSSPEYTVGEAVPVLYDPDEPQQAAINAFDLLWGGVGLLTIFGGCCLGVGLCNLWLTAVPSRRQIRHAATLPELWQAYRAGRLTRASEYQGLLVAFSFVSFVLGGATLAVTLFGSSTARWVMAAVAVYTVVQIARGRLHRD